MLNKKGKKAHKTGVSAVLLAPERLWEHKATVIALPGRMLERGSGELPGSQDWKHH